jgi:hypothetical protein
LQKFKYGLTHYFSGDQMRHTIKRPEQKTIVNRAVRSGEIRIELAEISQKARKGILTPAETQRFRALQAEKKRLQQN